MTLRKDPPADSLHILLVLLPGSPDLRIRDAARMETYFVLERQSATGCKTVNRTVRHEL